MAAFTKFESFVEVLAEGGHNLGADTLEIALTNAANPPVVGDDVLADLTQISYTNLTADRTLTVSDSSQTGGVYKLTITDKVLAASGGSVAAFRYVVIFNQDAASDELIGFYDYGSEITLLDGEDLTIDFDGTNGVLTIT